jgi:hypothetical protein
LVSLVTFFCAADFWLAKFGLLFSIRPDMIFPQLARFTDLALLLLRDIEMSKGFTIFLGLAELAGSLGVVFGILGQPAAIGLILIMVGAI